MRTYVVKAGDSPASIAAQDGHASCPKCSVDLIRCNQDRPIVTLLNGYVTFASLQIGDILRLPDKWFEPRFELLPPAYFGSLPYADGVTPSPFGTMAPVILRDFRALDVAANKLCALREMDNTAFASNVADAAEAIDAATPSTSFSAQPTLSMKYAQDAQQAVRWAAQCNKAFSAFHAMNLPAATKARTDVQNALASALSNAQYAMRDKWATAQPSNL